MPLVMDVHNLEGGVKADDVAQAHQVDLKTQGRISGESPRLAVGSELVACPPPPTRQEEKP